MTPQEFISFVKADFDLTLAQEEQFLACDALYREWNAKINVISRKDIDGLYDHHVLHSLAIARYLLTDPELHCRCPGPRHRRRLPGHSAGHPVPGGPVRPV